jgi:uncharacterized membrane protein
VANQVNPIPADINETDKRWAMLAYLPIVGWIFALIILLSDDKKVRPFQKFAAVQTIALMIVVAVTSIIVIGACLYAVVLFYTIYLAIKANQGLEVKVPWLGDFIKSKGWA